MDNSIYHTDWDSSNNTEPIDTQAIDPNFVFGFLDPTYLLLEPEPPINTSIDSILATSQDFQNVASSNQELSYNLGFDNETTSLDDPFANSYELPSDDKKADIPREVQDMLQKLQSEIVSLGDQIQMVQAELRTVQSNHAELLRWTIDMSEAMRALIKRLGEHLGMEAMGQQGFRVEDLASWLNPGSEG